VIPPWWPPYLCQQVRQSRTACFGPRAPCNSIGWLAAPRKACLGSGMPSWNLLSTWTACMAVSHVKYLSLARSPCYCGGFWTTWRASLVCLDNLGQQLKSLFYPYADAAWGALLAVLGWSKDQLFSDASLPALQSVLQVLAGGHHPEACSALPSLTAMATRFWTITQTPCGQSI
jgi:hypothetical protein